ncbi:MAG: hypothetical protein RR115_00955 [Hydrogenoanaerobacterium sp.]
MNTDTNYTDVWGEHRKKRDAPPVLGALGEGRRIYVKDNISAVNAERVATGEPPMQVVIIDPMEEYQKLKGLLNSNFD